MNISYLAHHSTQHGSDTTMIWIVLASIIVAGALYASVKLLSRQQPQEVTREKKER